MNISARNLTDKNPLRGVQDLHFRVQGPVVRHLQETFCEDWQFADGEVLDGKKWFPALEAAGPVVARGVSEGPDEDMDKLLHVVLGALACAEKSVKIMTPYFLPEAVLISALNVAALRGVQIDILLPEKSDHRLVQWAAQGQLDQILHHENCRLWLVPPPFMHTKMMVMDDAWSFIGSGNWDPRSFRLNFEFNIECYNGSLARRLNVFFAEKAKSAKPVDLKTLNSRSLPVRLRDGLARLLLPYL